MRTVAPGVPVNVLRFPVNLVGSFEQSKVSLSVSPSVLSSRKMSSNTLSAAASSLANQFAKSGSNNSDTQAGSICAKSGLDFNWP